MKQRRQGPSKGVGGGSKTSSDAKKARSSRSGGRSATTPGASERTHRNKKPAVSPRKTSRAWAPYEEQEAAARAEAEAAQAKVLANVMLNGGILGDSATAAVVDTDGNSNNAAVGDDTTGDSAAVANGTSGRKAAVENGTTGSNTTVENGTTGSNTAVENGTTGKNGAANGSTATNGGDQNTAATGADTAGGSRLAGGITTATPPRAPRSQEKAALYRSEKGGAGVGMRRQGSFDNDSDYSMGMEQSSFYPSSTPTAGIPSPLRNLPHAVDGEETMPKILSKRRHVATLSPSFTPSPYVAPSPAMESDKVTAAATPDASGFHGPAPASTVVGDVGSKAGDA